MAINVMATLLRTNIWHPIRIFATPGRSPDGTIEGVFIPTIVISVAVVSPVDLLPVTLVKEI